MTALSSKQLEQGILTNLKSDTALLTLLGGAKLYDEPRRNAPFPYLTLVTSYSRDWSTGTEQGEEHRIAITVWTSSNDRELQQNIWARLRALLSETQAEMSDHYLINLQIERLELLPDRKNHLLQGVMQLRAVTEPKSN
nr:DUF3168 domain-containing protein [uncultured Cohaesibacter sp.]